MATQDLLRNKVDETPTIYAYTLPDVPKYRGLLKVGYTSRPGTIRIKEQGYEENGNTNVHKLRFVLPNFLHFLTLTAEKLAVCNFL